MRRIKEDGGEGRETEPGEQTRGNKQMREETDREKKTKKQCGIEDF